MAEFAHHRSWLEDALRAIESAEKKGVDDDIRTILENGRRTCLAILEQNATSELAKDTMATIDALLSGTAPNPVGMSTVHGDADAAYAPNAEVERALGEKIARMEERFLAYGEDRFLPMVRRLPETNGREKGLKNALSYPFDTVKANVSNPLKNLEVVKRLAEEAGTPWYAMLLTMPNPRHFAYGSAASVGGAAVNAAGYAPLQRLMVFDERIDFSNDMDMLIVLHECLHMPQMNARLMRTPEWFVRFYGTATRPRVIANDEYQTYGFELESMDMLTGGMLRKAARDGKAADREALMKALNARPEQWMMVEMLSQFGEKFFPHGDAVSNSYPPAYAESIKRMCVHDGYDVFELDGGGQLRAV